MLCVPSNATPLIFFAETNFVAVSAFPINLVAVISLAAKSPEASLATKNNGTGPVSAFTFHVCISAPLNVDPDPPLTVIYAPAVNPDAADALIVIF